MAYDEELADRIREKLAQLPEMTEKEMFGGIAFMYHGKMCVGIIQDELMCRIDPGLYEEVLEKNGCREMDFTGRPMRGWVMVETSGFSREADFDYWIQCCLDYNQKAKKSVKKRGRR